jgi:hypothetical protein
MCFDVPDVIVHGDYANDFVDMKDFKLLFNMYRERFLL